MDNKRIIIINIGIAFIAILVWWVTSNWKQWGADNNLGMQFVGLMAITIVFGLLFVTLILPAIGDRIGEFFYSAPEESEPDAYSKASAKVLQGDYEGAIEAYREITAEDPDNRMPIIEIAKIQNDNLKNSDAAIATIEHSIQSKEWEIEDAAFLMFRLHDLYLHEKNDSDQARSLLEQVIEKFPNTRHSANAHHKINELNANQ